MDTLREWKGPWKCERGHIHYRRPSGADLCPSSTGIEEAPYCGARLKPYDRRAPGWVSVKERLPERPHIICLCGSTRFTAEMLITQWELSKAGNIVLSWCALPDGYFEREGGKISAHIAEAEGVKESQDELHKRKIDLADEVLVINLGGYIGESTRSEIEYAKAQGKPVRYSEPLPEPPRDGEEK